MCAVQACADLNADQANRASLTMGKWTFGTASCLCVLKMKRPGGTRNRGVFGVDPAVRYPFEREQPRARSFNEASTSTGFDE